MGKRKKSINYNIQLNEIQQTDDPTIIPCTFIILDFDVSYNNSIITKEVALGSAPTLLNKAIVAKYHEVEEPNTNTDAFGGHEAYLKQDKYGDTVIDVDTVPIGVFTTEGYILEIGEGDNKKEVLACDAVLWRSRFSDAIDLLLEWHNRGININTSCELLYMNYTVQDGIEIINSPIYFDGHAILNSESRGEHEVVLPAYEESRLLSFNEITQFQRLVAQAVERENINQLNNKKEEDSVSKDLYKKIYELSHSDIRTRLYKVLDESLGEGYWTWIVDTYDEKFIVEIGSEDGYKYFEYSYSKSEDDVITIDFESKTEVIEERKWVSLESTQELQAQLNEANEKLAELETKEVEFTKQLNSQTEELKELKELREFKASIEKAEAEAEIAEKIETQKTFYSAKFSALNASEKFESEEVQALIGKSIFEDNEGVEAKLQLNSMLVDMLEVKENAKEEKTFVREFASAIENLIPESTDFESRYGI